MSSFIINNTNKCLAISNKKTLITIFALTGFFLSSFSCLADNEQAREAYSNGLKKMEEKSYRAAAEDFNDAIRFADSVTLKVNALNKAAVANRKANRLYQEFICLKNLISRYPSECNVDKLVKREYEIGNKFFSGYREKPYWWMPWIENDDKTKEIYETILKQLPYSNFAPVLLIKLGIIYLRDNENEKAIAAYRNIIENYGESKSKETAYLDLAFIYLQLAAKGDGDGSKTKSARKYLIEFIKKYPQSKEIAWAKNSLKETYEMEANRLYQLAEFYYKKNNQKAAKRYIKQVLVNFPETRAVAKSEKLLDKIDMPLYPMTKLPEKGFESKYKLYKLPTGDEEDSELIIPENSGGKWLIPIDNLGIHKEKELQNKYRNSL